MADMKKVYDNLIIISLYVLGKFLFFQLCLSPMKWKESYAKESLAVPRILTRIN